MRFPLMIGVAVTGVLVASIDDGSGIMHKTVTGSSMSVVHGTSPPISIDAAGTPLCLLVAAFAS